MRKPKSEDIEVFKDYEVNVSLLLMCTIVMIAFKCGYLDTPMQDWSWWIILLPIWLPISLVVVAVIITLIVIIIKRRIQ